MLMCAQNLIDFETLNFNNFLSKHSVSMKLLLIYSTVINWESNTIDRTCIAYT